MMRFMETPHMSGDNCALVRGQNVALIAGIVACAEAYREGDVICVSPALMRLLNHQVPPAKPASGASPSSAVHLTK